MQIKQPIEPLINIGLLKKNNHFGILNEDRVPQLQEDQPTNQSHFKKKRKLKCFNPQKSNSPSPAATQVVQQQDKYSKQQEQLFKFDQLIFGVEQTQKKPQFVNINFQQTGKFVVDKTTQDDESSKEIQISSPVPIPYNFLVQRNRNGLNYLCPQFILVNEEGKKIMFAKKKLSLIQQVYEITDYKNILCGLIKVEKQKYILIQLKQSQIPAKFQTCKVSIEVNDYQTPRVIKVEMVTPPEITVTRLTNIKPIWSDLKEAYVLNFMGRKMIPSVKNIILKNQDNERVLLFGKHSQDEFNLDFSQSISYIQALCIAVASCQFKY